MNWKVPLADLDYGPEEEEAVLKVTRFAKQCHNWCAIRRWSGVIKVEDTIRREEDGYKKIPSIGDYRTR